MPKDLLDLVLMDCNLPELDGFETTRRIRRQETDGGRVPVIALTAYALIGYQSSRRNRRAVRPG